MNTSKTNKTTKTTKTTSPKMTLDQIKKDIRTTVRQMSRPKGSYGEILELNKRLTKQLTTYTRLNNKKPSKVEVKVSL